MISYVQTSCSIFQHGSDTPKCTTQAKTGQLSYEAISDAFVLLDNTYLQYTFCRAAYRCITAYQEQNSKVMNI